MSTAFPLSFAQRRLCFLHGLDPTGHAHSSARCFQVTGPLDLHALQAAVERLVARHEPLRTFFPPGEHQHVAATGSAHVRVLDVPDEAEALRRAEALASQPFDLESGPLLRVTVLRLTSERHVLMVSAHLLVADGWSLQVFFEELALAYRRALTRESSEWPELPVQYVDWAAWQREQLTEPRREALTRWWCQHLEGVPLWLDLVPRPRPQGRGRRMHRVLPAEVITAVHAFAGAERQTVFTVLAAACGVLLGHCSGGTQVLLGLAVANRELPEVEGVLGFFVNTVALRIDLRGDPDVRELLARVAEATASASAHQDLPFEQLVAALNPPREPARSPVVQVNFAHHPPGTLGVLALHGCTVRELPLEVATAKFELTLRVEERTDGESLVWAEFDEGVFEPGYIDGFLSAYERILRGLASGGPVSRLLPARAATERLVSRIFAEVLGRDAVGPHDDFFRLGGHSLLLMEVARRIRAEPGRDIGLRDLYATPTVAAIAARLDPPGALR